MSARCSHRISVRRNDDKVCEPFAFVSFSCPECDKTFNCPANLASHRRWHKPQSSTVSADAAAPPRKPLPNKAVRPTEPTRPFFKPSSIFTDQRHFPLSIPPTLDLRRLQSSCIFCHEQFGELSELIQHIRKTHSVASNSSSSKTFSMTLSEFR